MNADLALSILDFQHPGASVALACAAEEWGFKRYWLGEHHSSSQCANPLLLGALLAGTTNRLRIGSGGVSLTYRNVLQVAEDARLIEFMMPGRFDLGVTRGLLDEGPTADALLEGRPPLSGSEYVEKVRTLHGLLTGRFDPGNPLSPTRPYLEEGPPLWILGLSENSARLAASLGAGFCFSVHHDLHGIDGPALTRLYRTHFVPSLEFPEPTALVVVRCICAASEAKAKALEADLVAPEAPANETILGSPWYCTDRIVQIAGDFSADEVMIIDFLQKDQDVRLEMYRLLGKELGLTNALPDP
jgi:luciferase family oxidoreductase group 1